MIKYKNIKFIKYHNEKETSKVFKATRKIGISKFLNPFNSLVTSYSNVVDNLEVEAGDK